MLAPSVTAINADLIAKVCSSGWPESMSLEFKRDAPGYSDKDKHELLKDVSALANADGGDIVFGINEANGVASELTPIFLEDADALSRRINQTIESGIEPRILGLQFISIDVEGGYIFVVRVPASFLGPHAVKVNNNRRFVMRNGTSTSDMTFDQIRLAFDRTATLTERARSLVFERNELLKQRLTPKPLIIGPIKAVHFVPLNGIAGKQKPNLQKIYSEDFMKLIEADWGGGGKVFNLDGVVVYPGGRADEGHYGYALVLRSGAMESASLGGGGYQEHSSEVERFYVWSLDMTKYFRERTTTFLNLAKEQGISGPAILSFSLLHVTNYELGIDSNQMFRRSAKADRDHLIAPELWIDNLEAANVDEVVRPLLDTLWQGFGVERCLDFDAITGAYKPRPNY